LFLLELILLSSMSQGQRIWSTYHRERIVTNVSKHYRDINQQNKKQKHIFPMLQGLQQQQKLRSNKKTRTFSGTKAYFKPHRFNYLQLTLLLTRACLKISTLSRGGYDSRITWDFPSSWSLSRHNSRRGMCFQWKLGQAISSYIDGHSISCDIRTSFNK